MELVASGSQQRKSSPDSTQDSTEHHLQHHSMAPAAAGIHQAAQFQPALPGPAGGFFLHGGESSCMPSSQHVKEEQAALGQVAAAVYSVEQLGWDTHELMHSMSPESADLCKNLSSQLEHLRKEFGSCYSESSSSSHHMHHQMALEAGPSGVGTPSEMNTVNQNQTTSSGSELASGIHPEMEMLKASIVSHPRYRELVAAHMNCHKVGAPPEVATQIDEIIQSFKDFQPAVTTSIGVNPELDQFMLSYYSMLMKYEKEIKKTFREAVAFCKKLEQQLQGVANVSLNTVASVESDERNEGYETSDEEDSSAEAEIEVDPMAKDKELKEQLMRKYSGYITSLKHEFLKKKKKGKLPKDSRQQLLNWWSLHYKWPYPSESEKASLAESTGLDQKQINNWFINQRKRHWKPSDDISPLGGQASQSTVGDTNSGA